MPVLHIGVENNTDEKIYMSNFESDDDDASHVNYSYCDDKHYIDPKCRREDVFRIGNFFGFTGSASLFCGDIELGKVEFIMPFSGKNRFNVRSYNETINGREFTLVEKNYSTHDYHTYVENKFIVVNSTAVRR